MKNKTVLRQCILVVALLLFMACKDEAKIMLDQKETSTVEQHKDGRPREDGRMPPREGRRPEGDRQRPPMADVFKQMDVNNDEKLSKEEVRGPLKKDFTKIDTNEDGFLVMEELQQAKPPKGGR